MNAYYDEEVVNINQAVTKDLTSSSKFSGSCVQTLQTLPRRKKINRKRQRRIHFLFRQFDFSIACVSTIHELISTEERKKKDRMVDSHKHLLFLFEQLTKHAVTFLIFSSFLRLKNKRDKPNSFLFYITN